MDWSGYVLCSNDVPINTHAHHYRAPLKEIYMYMYWRPYYHSLGMIMWRTYIKVKNSQPFEPIIVQYPNILK